MLVRRVNGRSVAILKCRPSPFLPSTSLLLPFSSPAGAAAMLNLRSLLAASMLAPTSPLVLAATAGTFVDGGNTLISAMMVSDENF